MISEVPDRLSKTAKGRSGDLGDGTRQTRHVATYPANLCPLLFGGEFAKFGSEFGEAVDQAIEYRQRVTTGRG